MSNIKVNFRDNINYLGATFLVTAQDLFTNANLNRISAIAIALLENLGEKATEHDVLRRIMFMAKSLEKTTNFMFVFSLLKTWWLPVNSRTITNKNRMVMQTIDVLKALKIPDEKINVTQDQLLGCCDEWFDPKREINSEVKLEYIVRQALKKTVGGDKGYNDKEEFLHFFKTYIAGEMSRHISGCSYEEAYNGLSLLNFNSIDVSAPSTLEKLSWASFSAGIVLDAGYLIHEAKLYDFASLGEKLGVTKLFKPTFAIGTLITAGFFIGHLFRFLESTNRVIEIEDRREKASTVWDGFISSYNMGLFAASLAGLDQRIIRNLTAGIRSLDLCVHLGLKPTPIF